MDTAPVMEKPLAEMAGVGWRGKHTNLVSRRYGSWLFLGSLFTTLALYRDDDLIPTAMLLTLITAVGGIAALMIQAIVQTHSLFAAMVLAIVAPFTYFVRALVLIPVFAALVWVARKFRRFLAPDTMIPPNGAA